MTSLRAITIPGDMIKNYFAHKIGFLYVKFSSTIHPVNRSITMFSIVRLRLYHLIQLTQHYVIKIKSLQQDKGGQGEPPLYLYLLCEFTNTNVAVNLLLQQVIGGLTIVFPETVKYLSANEVGPVVNLFS